MSLYVDTSALLKRYVAEHDSDLAEELMAADPVLVTSRLTEIEIRQNLTRLLHPDEAARAKSQFLKDLDALHMVSLDVVIVSEAARIAEQTLCRSLDALHLASAFRTGPATTLLTFDNRQAQAARSLGLTVIGA
ncbi:type II toxin-antitoxin system VapC family toxin [Candidatus Poriferisocius sp.]|uniref:type II toxin-antitoxin system VapC family toxin n=1 Tax=Candidatus Poriferisocius sp. TaxID=3101276 RepID=UPI003B02A9C0